MRFFNTAGPVVPEWHYCLPPLSRFNLEEILILIEQRKYFVLHAPRQTGKTTCLLALMKYLNETGQYRALYANVEMGQAAREDVARAMKPIIAEIGERARDYLQDRLILDRMAAILEQSGESGALKSVLTEWAADSPLPIVLMLDEVDALIGDTLISLLRQIRSGYDKRPSQFPQSIILCGVRDVRDYRIHSSQEKAIITGGSAFNIKAESLRLGDFSPEEVEQLYQQHTTETGQQFETGVLNAVWDLTRGQPWLVNALGYETCFKMKEGRDRTQPITVGMIETAKENLILRRETHLDQLADKLSEPRVRRVMEPLVAGEDLGASASEDDIQYILDLGLIRRSSSGLEVSNGIYREVIPRQLTAVTQIALESTIQSEWYILPDGKLDMEKLLQSFQEFFREHSEHWVERFDYKEAGPQLLLQAFLQRIVNGGGRVEREYGLGRKRTDLLIVWPVKDTAGKETSRQKVVLELKIVRSSIDWTIQEGLPQTLSYMDRSGTKDGHLVLFDHSPKKSWEEKIFCRSENYEGYDITVWGM